MTALLGRLHPRALAGLTPSGRARVPAAWSLYDFANTIFSFAIVSFARAASSIRKYAFNANG